MSTNKTYTIPTYAAFGWLVLSAFLAVFGSLLPVENSRTIHGDFLDAKPFTAGHWFGVDSNGYDIFSGIINGARLSLFVAFITVGIGGFIGSLLGITAAYFRGRYTGIQCASKECKYKEKGQDPRPPRAATPEAAVAAPAPEGETA